MNTQMKTRITKLRRGAILSEAMVSAAILMAGIGIVARTHYNLRRLWGDTRHFQLATDELCNQFDRLTTMPRNQLTESLKNLHVSQEIAAILPESSLSGKLIEDPTGSRIQLSIDWKRIGEGKPLELVGWLRTPESSATELNNPAISAGTEGDSTTDTAREPSKSPSDAPVPSEPNSADEDLKKAGAKS